MRSPILFFKFGLDLARWLGGFPYQVVDKDGVQIASSPWEPSKIIIVVFTQICIIVAGFAGNSQTWTNILFDNHYSKNI